MCLAADVAITDDLTAVVDGGGLGERPSGTAAIEQRIQIGHHAAGIDEGVLIAEAGVRNANDSSASIDAGGDADGSTRESAEVSHDTACIAECMKSSISYNPRITDDGSGVVDRKGVAARGSTQGSKIGHHPARIPEGVRRAAVIGSANDGAAAIAAVGDTGGSAQRAEIGHHSARIAKSVEGCISGGAGLANDGSSVVDRVGLAGGSPERAEIGHHSARITEGMSCRRRVGLANDGSTAVDATGEAVGSTESAKISHHPARIAERVETTPGIGTAADDGSSAVDAIGVAVGSTQGAEVGDAVEHGVGGRDQSEAAQCNERGKS